MNAHNTIISINAHPVFSNPKNIIVQNVFNNNWTKNTSLALIWILFFSAKYNETPIRIYNIVHTGANIQFGGLKEGLTKCEYQLLGPVVVNNVPIRPASKHNIIHPNIFTASRYGLCLAIIYFR